MNTIAANGAMALRVREGRDPVLLARILSALVLLPVAVAVVLLGGWPLTVLVAAAGALMIIEWDRLCGDRRFGALGVVQTAVVLVAIVATPTAGAVWGLVALIAGAALAAAMAPMSGRSPSWPGIGVLYVGLPCIAILWLREIPDAGRDILLWLLALVWATDIGAFVVGRSIGGPRLAPRVSPGKTWSGLAGGIVSGAGVGAAAAIASGTGSALGLAAISAVLAVVAQIGDLAESAVKRRFGVKDSGRIIPGHGGVLDRLDGVLAVAPAVALVLWVQQGGMPLWP